MLYLSNSLRHAYAQGNELVVMPNQHAEYLVGTVTSRAGDPLDFVQVSIIRFDCGYGEFHGSRSPIPLESVVADKNGSFHIRWPKASRVCLQFQALGMNTLQMEVRRKHGAGHLHPKLAPGA